jgi:predicted nucleic-acid-binding protein
MLSIDTNVLVRVLVDDAEAKQQCTLARQTVADASHIFVSQVVQIETAWVLMRAYGLSSVELKAVFEQLMVHSAFTIQHLHVFQRALDCFVSSHTDFADCMILAESQFACSVLATFDKKLSRQQGCLLLSQ